MKKRCRPQSLASRLTWNLGRGRLLTGNKEVRVKTVLRAKSAGPSTVVILAIPERKTSEARAFFGVPLNELQIEHVNPHWSCGFQTVDKLQKLSGFCLQSFFFYNSSTTRKVDSHSAALCRTRLPAASLANAQSRVCSSRCTHRATLAAAVLKMNEVMDMMTKNQINEREQMECWRLNSWSRKIISSLIRCSN